MVRIYQLVATVFLFVCPVWGGGDTAQSLRYRLEPGDHLVYRQTMLRERKSISPEKRQFQSTTEYEWRSHVLVVDKNEAGILAGFQRNRVAADLLSSSRNGKDQLPEQRRVLAERLRQTSPYFGEANWLTQAGQPLLPWTAVREFRSPSLPALHEIPVLPSQPVGLGDTWPGPGLLGITMRAAAWEEIGKEKCLRVESVGDNDSLRLQYWFCPDSGVVKRIELEIRFDLIAVAMIQEKFTWELLEHRRGESPVDWLEDEELRMGVLASLARTSKPAVPPEFLYRLLEAENPEIPLKVLGLTYRNRWPGLPVETLQGLSGHTHPRIRTLAVRLLEQRNVEAARPIIDRAKKDKDYFVRTAAHAWERRQSGRGKPGDRSPLALEATGQYCAARAEENGAPAGAPQYSVDIPGATVRPMQSKEFRGRPYVMYVPEDYRGDEPIPLLIYLSGSGGRALEGILGSMNPFRQRGFLVALPDAGNQYWWLDDPTAVSTALLNEVSNSFNVDSNRVYLAGFSNGGTGTVFFSALWPDRLAAAVPLMGSGLWGRGKEEEMPRVLNLTKLPMLFVHGDKDRTIPVDTSLDTVAEIKRVSRAAPAEIQVLRGWGHGILIGRDKGLTLPFLEKHRRAPFPKKISFETRTLQYARHHWVEILAKDQGVAQVKAEIRKRNEIRVKTKRVQRLRLRLRPELFGQEGPVKIVVNGKKVFEGLLRADCDLFQRSQRETGDPFLAYSTALEFPIPD